MQPLLISFAGRHWPLLLAGALMGGVGAASLPPYRPAACNADTRFSGMTLADGRAVHAVVVTSLRSGAGAPPSGVAVGDRIETVDGHHVSDLHQLNRALAQGNGTLAEVRLRHAKSSYTVALAEDCHDASHPRGRR